VKARLVLATLLDDDDDVDLEFNLIKNTVQQERVRILTYASLNPPGRQYVLPLFLVFNDFGQTNYLAIYQTDLRHVLRVGRIVAVDERSEISFSIPQGTLP